MQILNDLFTFIDFVCIYGVNLAKDSDFYRKISEITNSSEKPHYAVPYQILFHNHEYLDIIIHDYVHSTISYDKESKSFVFFSMQDLFDGILAIFHKIHLEYPHDPQIVSKIQKIQLFISMIDNAIDMEELCDNMSKSRI